MAAMSLSERDVTAMREIVYAATSDDHTLRDGPGLPLSVLRALQNLVPCDELCVAGADWKVLGHYLDDSLYGPEDEEIVRFMAQDPIAFDGAGPDHGFWGTFWVNVCSLPERTGDYTSVTRLSDFMSDRKLRDSQGYAENLGPRGFLHEAMVVWPDGQGRTLRVLFFRSPGRDFDEKDRFVLELLRPHLMAAYTPSVVAADPVAHLTPHQRTILRFVADGYTNAQIGRRMNLAEGTVRTHLNRMYHRLGVTSRTAAAAAYLRDEELRRSG